MNDTLSLFRTYNVQPRGVIHIGAHEGEELELYLQAGFKRILFVEANPLVFEKLKAHVAGAPGVILAQVAISDKPGTAMLHVTSMDQSSSILPLKLHKDIYPSITETGQVEVRTQTIDALLVELGLNAADFNYLHLDIQGAEFLAIQGAEKTLTHMEAINTEVNFAELYAECAHITVIEKHLGERGFNRVSLSRPYHPTWGDAFYVRRRAVVMSTLGRNGRFANQLFQYLYLRLVARQQNAVVQTPRWPGQALFGYTDTEILRTLPLLGEEQMAHPEALFDGTLGLKDDADIVGWFQLHSRHFAPHKDFIRQLFTLVPKLRTPFDAAVRKLQAGGRPIIALHLRRGDYGYHQFFRAPAAWYRQWLETLGPEWSKAVVYLCSEDPRPLRVYFPGRELMDFPELRIPLELAPYIDFYVLSHADAVAIANSSYSFLATMLNTRAKLFVRPSLETRSLVAYDPWNAPVIFPRHLKEGEQAELDAADAM